MRIIPDKFEGFYDIKYPETVKVWGEAAATCRWVFVCYEECEMHLKVISEDNFLTSSEIIGESKFGHRFTGDVRKRSISGVPILQHYNDDHS